jgi:hypothetical protein
MSYIFVRDSGTMCRSRRWSGATQLASGPWK